MNKIIERVESSVKNWWVSLLLGILFIAFAIFLIMYPDATYATLSIMFSAFMFVSGIFEIVFSVSNNKVLPNWGWYLAGGIIDLLIGLMLISVPGLSMAVLPFILAFWLMFRGFSGIGLSFDAKNYGSTNWGWLLAISLLTVLCSIGIIWMPAVGAMTYVLVAAMTFLIAGCYRVILAFDLKNIHTKIKKLHNKK